MIKMSPLALTLLSAIFVLALSACKQDQVFQQVSDMKQTSDQISTYAETMGSDPIKSCERIAVYYSAAKAVNRDSLEGIPPVALGCVQTSGQAAQLQKHLEIFALYADQLERAAQNMPVDYKLGNLTTALANAKLIGVGGSTDADAIGKLGNAIAAFFTSAARYNLIRATVLEENANVQEMAKYAEAVSVSDWCDGSSAAAHNTGMGYCAIFEPEMDAITTSYCIIGDRIFGPASSCPAAPPVFPTGPPAAAQTSDQAAPSDVCDAAVLRASLRDGTHLPLEAAPSVSAPVIKSSNVPNGSKLMSASEWQARQQLVTGYRNAVATVYDEVKVGWAYGTAVCEFARAHQRLYDSLNDNQGT
jgi:hypothetical protein